jgi:hypothetical protein
MACDNIARWRVNISDDPDFHTKAAFRPTSVGRPYGMKRANLILAWTSTKCYGVGWWKKHMHASCDWLWARRPWGVSASPSRGKSFLPSTSSSPDPGPTQPSVEWVPRALHPGVKRRQREADHSPPNSAEVRNTWIYTSTPPYTLRLGKDVDTGNWLQWFAWGSM